MNQVLDDEKANDLNSELYDAKIRLTLGLLLIFLGSCFSIHGLYCLHMYNFTSVLFLFMFPKCFLYSNICFGIALIFSGGLIIAKTGCAIRLIDLIAKGMLLNVLVSPFISEDHWMEQLSIMTPYLFTSAFLFLCLYFKKKTFS